MFLRFSYVKHYDYESRINRIKIKLIENALDLTDNDLRRSFRILFGGEDTLQVHQISSLALEWNFSGGK